MSRQAAPTPTSPVLDATLAERGQLAERRQALEEARDALTRILSEADARIAVAEAARDRIAAERGGRSIVMGALSDRRGRSVQWSFGGQRQPREVLDAIEVVGACEVEAAPVVDAIARVTGELAEVAADVQQVDERIASLRAELDRAQAERASRAALLGRLPDWAERAEAVLARLGLGPQHDGRR
jgi:hypothetical protein